MEIKFFNSMSRQKELFKPISGNTVKMYTCGPTVYNFAHIGNFRAYIFEDLLHRTLLLHGYKVKQIMNLTDVDDKTIKNSTTEKIPLKKYTQKYKDSFFEDIAGLQITPCAAYPAATDHIPEMVTIIKDLLKKGFAYKKDNSIYYRINSFKNYGKLAHLDKADLQAGASGRVDNDEYEKENASDFVLWKGYEESDGDIFWETEIGKGRPGWHIECSAMSMKHLGETIDIHTGGIDNLFPHHENEIAQSEATTGKKFVNYWLHCDYLIVNGEKMSKSKGNFFTFRDLLEKGYSKESIRYLLITSHYRKMLNFTEIGLKGADSAIQKVNSFIQDLLKIENSEKDENETNINEICSLAETNFKKGLFNDLNISKSMGAIFSAIKRLRETFPTSKETAKTVTNLFEMVNSILSTFNLKKEEINNNIETLIQQRNDARSNRDFAESDRIRNLLAEQGISLKDGPEGTTWEKK